MHNLSWRATNTVCYLLPNKGKDVKQARGERSADPAEIQTRARDLLISYQSDTLITELLDPSDSRV